MPVALAPPVPANPCRDPALHLVCPNLRMPPAERLHVRSTPGGRTLLLMDNRLVNVGPGELEFRGSGSRGREMQALQVVRRSGGRPRALLRTGAELYFKYVDRGRGAYWKFHEAARFELWGLDASGRRTTLLRSGPKLDYCLRDLFRRRGPSEGSVPHRAHYGACSQTRPLARVTLGVSVGWADGYPFSYPENWIDVTGLRGCLAVVQRADPLDRIREADESDNVSVRVVRLPLRAGPTGCAPYRGPTSPPGDAAPA